MVLITDKFWGPLGAESVIGGVHYWLAEAVNALQDNSDTLTAKVRRGEQGAGGPDAASRLPGPLRAPRSSRAAGTPRQELPGPGPKEKWPRGKLALQERPRHAAEAGGVASAGRAQVERAGQAGGASGGLDHCPQVPAKAQLRDAQDFWISLPGRCAASWP